MQAEYSNFVLIFPNFRYCGNKGWFEINFICTVTFTDPEQTLCGQESRTYLPYKQSYDNFCVKISKILLPWQQGSI